MRYVLLLFGLLAVPMGGANPFDAQRFFAFVHELSSFDRKLLGCPQEGFPPNIVCNAGLSVLDDKQRRRLRDMSRTAFGD